MKMRVPNYCAKTLVGCPRSRKFVGTSGHGLSRNKDNAASLCVGLIFTLSTVAVTL